METCRDTMYSSCDGVCLSYTFDGWICIPSLPKLMTNKQSQYKKISSLMPRHSYAMTKQENRNSHRNHRKLPDTSNCINQLSVLSNCRVVQCIVVQCIAINCHILSPCLWRPTDADSMWHTFFAKAEHSFTSVLTAQQSHLKGPYGVFHSQGGTAKWLVMVGLWRKSHENG